MVVRQPSKLFTRVRFPLPAPIMLTKKTAEDNEREAKIREALKTEEGRTALMLAMTEPLRCGGMTYIDGKAFIWYGGVSYPEEEFKAAYKANGSQWPEEWAKNYRDTRTTSK